MEPRAYRRNIFNHLIQVFKSDNNPTILFLFLAELNTAEFDKRDLDRLRGNDAEAELYLRLFIRSRQGDLEKAYTTMVHTYRYKALLKDLLHTFLCLQSTS